MPRIELSIAVTVVVVATVAAATQRDDPHLDSSLLPIGCSSCHVGHGVPGSPMLPTTQRDVCLGCHGSLLDRDRMRSSGVISLEARPPLIGDSLDQQSTHPMTDQAFETDAATSRVTCSSCHDPHRSVPRVGVLADGPTSQLKQTSVRGQTYEYETCNACHGQNRLRRDPNANRRDNIASLTESTSRSFHPIQVPTNRQVPSTIPSATGREINCTDCHGNGNTTDSKGPHGSPFPFVLVAQYETRDGQAESPETYALCYRCHDRGAVLSSPDFPYHARHVTGVNVSCATCHSPHGSMEDRALIRFGETPLPPEVTPSIETGILAFESSAPGSGACYLNCHGFEHAPAVYGSAGPVDAIREFGIDDRSPIDPYDPVRPVPSRPPRERQRRDE